jgi:hypothetical protein
MPYLQYVILSILNIALQRERYDYAEYMGRGVIILC